MKQEADDINNFASKSEVEELYRAFKDDSSTFKESKNRNKCDPAILRLHFETHFSSDAEQPAPNELTNELTLHSLVWTQDLQIVQIF